MTGVLSCSHHKETGFWPMNVGSSWTFAGKMGDQQFGQTYSVSDRQPEGNGEHISVTDTVDGKVLDIECYQKNANGLYRAGSDLRPSDGSEVPFLLLPAGIKPGQTWNWQGDVTKQGKKAKAVQKLTAVGIETVQTPSGRYQAIHIHSDLAVTLNGAKLHFPNDYWFAEGVGPVKLSAEVPGSEKLEETLTRYTLN